MTESVMTDKDVISLVRKEFERKISDYCEKHGIEPGAEETDEDVDSGAGEDEDDSNLGKRESPKAKKPERLNVDSIMRSIGLRVVHKDSNLEYYLRGLNSGSYVIDLESSDGTLFQVGFDEFEEDYRLA